MGSLLKNILKNTAAGALLSGGLAAAGLGIAGGPAAAEPAQAHTWCPGDALPFGSRPGSVLWDMNVCHVWYIAPFLKGNVPTLDVNGNVMETSLILADVPPPMLTAPPPPPPLPPGTPFCSPRGALIIIPPICDEIGVDLPRGILSSRNGG